MLKFKYSVLFTRQKKARLFYNYNKSLVHSFDYAALSPFMLGKLSEVFDTRTTATDKIRRVRKGGGVFEHADVATTCTNLLMSMLKITNRFDNNELADANSTLLNLEHSNMTSLKSIMTQYHKLPPLLGPSDLRLCA